ncbi:hypothetical protein [Cellulomonas alba]|uniref:Uncharacterized protein n=1 Tax=Cellulomonas alba TaxID=3053467 RepID=A0ABT7SCR5_9CELL|nr:hypothetical protein [Cellulomonas alba]MDM7853304.1 hypothetical protein [Cellulomonas alba]
MTNDLDLVITGADREWISVVGAPHAPQADGVDPESGTWFIRARLDG